MRRHRPRDVAAGARPRGAVTTTCTRRSACTRTTRRSSTREWDVLDALAGAERVRRDRRGRLRPPLRALARATSRRSRSGAQIRLANDVDQPLVIHSRDAWDDTFRVLDDEGVPERTIFHCFTGGPDEARARARPRLLPVVQRHRVVQERRRRCAPRPRIAPADRVLVETDAPYLAPVPHRGKPNEPAFVVAGRRRARRGARRRRRRDRRARRVRTRRGCSASSGDAEPRSSALLDAARAATEQGARPELPRRPQHGRAHRAARRRASPATASSRSGPGSVR